MTMTMMNNRRNTLYDHCPFSMVGCKVGVDIIVYTLIVKWGLKHDFYLEGISMSWLDTGRT